MAIYYKIEYAAYSKHDVGKNTPNNHIILRGIRT